MIFKKLPLAGLLLVGTLGISTVFAQEDQATTQTVVLEQAPEVAQALAFLERVEQKNKEMTGFTAKFTQERVNAGLMEDSVGTHGRFWYEAPDKFRANYEGADDSVSSSRIWMMEGKLFRYVPDLEEVEILHFEEGEEAPINQFLLGFGVKVDEIVKLFDVAVTSQKNNSITISFTSKDIDRSMGYNVIRVAFDEETIKPKKLVLEDSGQMITIRLKEVELNAEINESIFKTDWPEDVDISEVYAK